MAVRLYERTLKNLTRKGITPGMKSTRNFGILVVALIGTNLLTWLLASGPMLIRARFGPMAGDPRVSLFNPLRNKAPERYAASILSGVQSEECERATSSLAIPDVVKFGACGKQKQDPLAPACKLAERMDFGEQIWLSFDCPYRRPTEFRAHVQLTLEGRRKDWKLVSYERIY